ncbi:hypothetical protein CIK96_11605, partial [Prevotella sp. P4-98]
PKNRRFVNSPKTVLIKSKSRFLYYYFSVLCKSFKELFLQCLSGVVFLKADAKVRLFSELPNFFEKKMQIA